jgi:hypothetical protein
VRTIVLATSHDDPTALAEPERSLDADDYPRLVPILPIADEEQGRCSEGVEEWRLMQWLKRQRFDTFFACRKQRVIGGYGLSSRRRITGTLATRSDGTPACRVRVHLWSKDSEFEARCEPRRGWSGPVESASSLGDHIVTCDVSMLTGDDGSRCRDPRSTCSGCASGWCIVNETDPRLAGTWIRLTGGAGPSQASVEIACNLAR